MDDHINADEYIIIAPTLWEWDVQGSNTFNSFNVQLENDLDWAIAQTYPFANTVVSYSEPFDGRVIKIFDKIIIRNAAEITCQSFPIFRLKMLPTYLFHVT